MLQNKTRFFILAVLLCLVMPFWLWGVTNISDSTTSNNGSSTNAESTTNVNNSNNTQSEIEIEKEIEETQAQIDELEKKIGNYENLIEEKKKQQATLNGQIEIIEGEIKKNIEQINQSEQEMNLVELEIKSLELKIKEKDIDIEYNRKVLAELIRSLYRDSKNSSIEVLLKYNNLGDYFTELERMNQLNRRIKQLLGDLAKAKAELQSKQEEKNDKFKKLAKLRDESKKNKYYLESQQKAKAEILKITEGEEEKYQELLKKFEAQRDELLGNFEELEASKGGELEAVIAKQKKPKKGLASRSWYYSQRDPRWADDNIGMSRTKMDQYGCAVTSVSMVLRYHGVNITPGILAKQPIFYYDLIVWPSYWQGVQRTGSNAHGNIDWDKIDKELEAGNPVIIFIGAKGKGAGHYVVVHHKDKTEDDYVVHDPYWGANIYLSSTRENISILYGSGTYIDQMIVYHGQGGTYRDVEKETEEDEVVEQEVDKTPKEKCEESKGEWDKKKEKCRCPKKYEEKNGECFKK